MTTALNFSSIFTSSSRLFDSVDQSPTNLGFLNFPTTLTFKHLAPIKAIEGSRMPSYTVDVEVKSNDSNGINLNLKSIKICLFDSIDV